MEWSCPWHILLFNVPCKPHWGAAHMHALTQTFLVFQASERITPCKSALKIHYAHPWHGDHYECPNLYQYIHSSNALKKKKDFILSFTSRLWITSRFCFSNPTLLCFLYFLINMYFTLFYFSI